MRNLSSLSNSLDLLKCFLPKISLPKSEPIEHIDIFSKIAKITERRRQQVLPTIEGHANLRVPLPIVIVIVIEAVELTIEFSIESVIECNSIVEDEVQACFSVEVEEV